MPDYQKMYSALYNRITDVIEELIEIQQIAEEMYIISDESPVEIKSYKENREMVSKQKVSL